MQFEYKYLRGYFPMRWFPYKFIDVWKNYDCGEYINGDYSKCSDSQLTTFWLN